MPAFNRDDYVDVDTRISRYWEMHPKPEGSIQTEVIWVAEDGGAVAIRATVYQGDRILATGIAHEERGKSVKDGANFTSWWENAETSAIGRALANMDMSLSRRRPSAQEMDKVNRYQSAPAAPLNGPQRAQQALAPFTAAEYEQFIQTEWDRRIAGTPYEEIVASFARAKARFTPDQFDDAKEDLRRMKAWTPVQQEVTQ